jgi:P2-related tail formation protein
LIFFVVFCVQAFLVHPLFEKADRISREVIGAAIEVHRQKGPGLIESIYERLGFARRSEIRK